MTRIACLTVARVQPERPAVVCPEQTVTHGQLDRWTHQIACALRSLGVGPGHVVGVVPDGPAAGAVAALLAVLRVGASYTRLDAGRASTAATTLTPVTPSGPSSLSCVLADDPAAVAPAGVPVLPLAGAPAGAQLAGEQPAGDGPQVVLGGGLDDDVLVGHAGAVRGRAVRAYLQWALPAYPAAAGVAAVPALPATAAELAALLVPLLAGGCVQIGELEEVAWSGWRPTFAKLTPADLAALIELPDEASPTGELVLTGPRPPGDELARWRRRHPAAAVTWEYAPAAGELGCATLRLPPGVALPEGPPVVRPIPGTTFQVRDGVLYVCGESVPGPRPTGEVGTLRADGDVELTGEPPAVTGADAEVLREWESIYDQLYEVPGDRLGADFSGWNSSYTGEPIPLEEMREWQASTVDRIRALLPSATLPRPLHPRRVLEIGVGSGLLMERVAPLCDAYWATDLSGTVVHRLAEQVAARPDLAGRVVLRHCAAHDLAELPAGWFDVVVLNSVVQYFPTLDYLGAVLSRAVTLLRPGGAIFVGDVRNARLATVLQSAVRLWRARPDEDAAQVRADVARAVALDKELLVDPDFFIQLPERVAGIAAADVWLKRGRFHNELTRHRYDVVLRTAPPAEPAVAPVLSTVDELPARLAAGVPAVRVAGLANARLAGEVAAAAALAAGEPVPECRRRLTDEHPAVDPEDLAALGERAGYQVTLALAGDGFDALFTRSAATAGGDWRPGELDAAAGTLVRRFADQVVATPDAVAVVDGDRRLSYRDLAAAAQEVRRQLAGAGVPPGTLVGLRMPRCAEVVAAILGILAHGGAYVPVDPAYPRSRQEYIIADAGLDAVLEVDPASGRPVVTRTGGGPACPVPEGTAYVIYTSGSTGSPKGVMVGDCHVRALMDACAQRYAFSGNDVWTMFHSHSFDFSVWELFGALLYGGRVVIVPPQVAADPRAFAKLLAEEGVTVLSQVPTAFGHLVAELEENPVPLPALRYVVFGGEALNPAAVRTWRELSVAPTATLVNMYGITETTVHVTFAALDGSEGSLPGATPIGQPLPHLQVHLVDEQLRPVPAGEPGEMLVTGASVSYGYLNRPELTAERFVDLAGKRAYRSGDWARRDAEGRLHYLGRRDRQVQLRGFRVELGEPEAAIAAHPEVAQCAVLAETNQLGDLQLVAYYVPRVGADLEPDEVRAYLAQRLPGHLVPSRIRRLAALPRTAHDKVDLAALSRL
jgi:nonribosomal peptide synthetase DhbF